MAKRTIPIFNRRAVPVDIAVEPEGQCFRLAPGETLEVRYELEVGVDPEVAVEIQDELISIYCAMAKQVFRGGNRLR